MTSSPDDLTFWSTNGEDDDWEPEEDGDCPPHAYDGGRCVRCGKKKVKT